MHLNRETKAHILHTQTHSNHCIHNPYRYDLGPSSQNTWAASACCLRWPMFLMRPNPAIRASLTPFFVLASVCYPLGHRKAVGHEKRVTSKQDTHVSQHSHMSLITWARRTTWEEYISNASESTCSGLATQEEGGLGPHS